MRKNIMKSANFFFILYTTVYKEKIKPQLKVDNGFAIFWFLGNSTLSFPDPNAR